MTGANQTSATVNAAARWLAAEAQPPHPVIPALKARFSLSAAEAVEAIREANLRRVTAS